MIEDDGMSDAWNPSRACRSFLIGSIGSAGEHVGFLVARNGARTTDRRERSQGQGEETRVRATRRSASRMEQVDFPEVERKERGSWRSANVGWSGRTHARGGERWW